ncbi:MAG: DUF2914 domain-containing protein [Polyangiaceae bacterium]|nr:DUF2914 domain-containing protein [Polyangiaceae bacterium]
MAERTMRVWVMGSVATSVVALGVATFAATAGGAPADPASAPEPARAAEPPSTQVVGAASAASPGAPVVAPSQPGAGAGALSDAPAVGTATSAVATSTVPPAVRRLVVAREVAAREPVDLGDVVLDGRPVVAFLELASRTSAAGSVLVTFEHPATGKRGGFVQLRVPAGAARHRTWARTRAVDVPGEWVAVVRSVDGKELARQSFTVVAPLAAAAVEPGAAGGSSGARAVTEGPAPSSR